jgi:cytochrome c
MRVSESAFAIGFALAVGLAGASAAQTPVGDEDAGHDTFMQECRVCHLGGIAPSLKGVVGRKVAGDHDFTGYTDALKAKADQVWTEGLLDSFLANPAAFAPGTRMTKVVDDPQTRANLIAYLKSVPAPK